MLAGLVNSERVFDLYLSFNYRGTCGSYLRYLRHTIDTCSFPDSSNTQYIQLIEASFRNVRGQTFPISLIEMSGEKFVEFYQKENPKGFSDLGPGTESILNNNNRKVVFLFIDSKDLYNTSHSNQNSSSYIRNCDVLSKLVSLFACYPSFLKKVNSIDIVLTKSDLCRDYLTFDYLQDRLLEHGYGSLIHTLKGICQEYSINTTVGYQVGIYPFSVGKFMPGDLYEFDETDSLRILRLIQSHISFPIPKTKWTDLIKEWLNSD